MRITFIHKLPIGIASLLLIMSACSKKKTGPIVSSDGSAAAYAFEEALYGQAYNNGDHHTAVVAINRMLLIDSTQTHYYDSLSRHYVALGNARSASLYAEKALEQDPGNLKMLEMAGYIYFEGGSFKKSEEKFNKLYDLTKEHKYLYQLAQVYGYMGDIRKSNEMTDLILKDPAADSVFIDVATSDGQMQMVQIKAACHFVKANLQKTPRLAMGYLQKALSIQPNFELARKIRDEMELQQKMQEAQETEAKLNRLRSR